MKPLHLGLSALALAAAPAWADYLAGATGHTEMKCAPGTKHCGVVHFAVLDRNGGTYGDTWRTGLANFDFRFDAGTKPGNLASPRLDYSARYLYLYQVTNDSPVGMFSASIPFFASAESLATSWGRFSGVGFADDKAMTGISVPVSVTSSFGLKELVPGGEPSMKVINPAVVIITVGEDAGHDPYEVLLGGRAIRAAWIGNEGLPVRGRSTIFGFTSNHPPGFLKGSIVLKCGHAGEPPCPKKNRN